MYEKGNVFFECECGYKIPHLIAAKHLTDEEVRQLMRGKTGLIKGFKSKTGKRFDAVLIADENGTVKFDFKINKKHLYSRKENWITGYIQWEKPFANPPHPCRHMEGISYLK